MKKSTIAYLFITIAILLYIPVVYFNYLQDKRASLEKVMYDKEAQTIKKSLELLILAKKKSTLAIAISLANDKTLIQEIKNRKINQKKYQHIIKNYKNDTLYKNIWIQIIDKNGISMYRSWTSEKGDNLANYRPEFQNFSLKKENYTSVSVGRYDLSIKAISRIVVEGKVIGAIEIISHFNSIAKLLQHKGIESVMILKKEYTKQLTHPFTKLFLEKNYYIANVDALKEHQDYLSSHKINRYFNDNYKLENGYLIISSAIKDVDNRILGFSIMFKKLQDISTLELKYFMFKYISLFIILGLIGAIALVVILFIQNKKQKHYYQNILDSTANIVLVTDDKEIQYVNELFFQYFHQYEDLGDLHQNHFCICDLFVKEEGFLEKNMNGILWIEYLSLNNKTINKVKININNQTYIFAITASILKESKNKVLVVLQDISSEEQLLHVSITDELTQIGNRRHFNLSLDSEVSRATRYDSDLSLIMCDIDFFKHVNDKYGHDKGDEVLIQTTELIKTNLRNEEIFCRVGGEEFVIIVPNICKEDAEKIAEKLRGIIEENKRPLPVTMSFGVTELYRNENAEQLYKRVDEALYQAKESGRNRVIVR